MRKYDLAAVEQGLELRRGRRADRAAVLAALYEEDADENLKECTDCMRWEEWDKETPINGVPASEVLKRTDIAQASRIYLIYINDQLVFLQPHHPDSAGEQPLTSKSELKEVAEAHVTQIAEEEAFGRLLDRLEKAVNEAEASERQREAVDLQMRARRDRIGPPGRPGLNGQ